jgi:response regulator RpfG family c-di-GMP phosphodiesterase/DNA-binding CsgD family transcriptional regulator
MLRKTFTDIMQACLEKRVMEQVGLTAPNLGLRTQALGVLAFAGDLSMGQTVDHSPRTALLAARLADSVGLGTEARTTCVRLSLLRWAGCTGNAREFADLFGDDISGRAALIADQNPFVARPFPTLPLDGLIVPLARAHCEAAQEIATRLQLGKSIAVAAADLFEWWNGGGFPAFKRGEEIDTHAQVTALAGDLEVFVRTYGYAKAITLIESRAGLRYDPSLVREVVRSSATWLQALEESDPWHEAAIAAKLDDQTALDITLDQIAEVLGDYADLKLPHAAGAARRIRDSVSQVCAKLGYDVAMTCALEQAALLCTLGQVSVPNTILERKNHLSEADWEQVRLIPHWTTRALSRAPAFAVAQKIAGEAFERLDGSGFHRGLMAQHLALPARVLQSAVLWEILQTGRCWQPSLVAPQRDDYLRREVIAGRLDASVVQTLSQLQTGLTRRAQMPDEPTLSALTARERDILRLLANGLSNKQMARELAISPSTAGTHVENIYRKLHVTTRAAATLKAASLGVLA